MEQRSTQARTSIASAQHEFLTSRRLFYSSEQSVEKEGFGTVDSIT